MTRSLMPAYCASFRLGMRESYRSRGDVISRLLVFALLMVIYYGIYHMMKLAQFGVDGLTAEKLLWYFAVTETVTVSSQGLRRAFGKQIATGELTTLIQRPGSMMGMVVMRLFGTFCGYATLVILGAMIGLPLLASAPLPMPLAQFPLLLVAIAQAGLVSLLSGYLISMLEVFGPYSQPVDWIVSKLIMALGGLFLPISLFPEWAEKIAWLTPFPAILFVPASLMLGADSGQIAERILLQSFWLVLLLAVVVLAEARLVRRVLTVGD